MSNKTYLVDLGKQEPSQKSTEDAQRARNEERVLASSSCVGRMFLGKRKDVAANESTDLANGGRIRVVLPTNRGGTSLGRDQTNVITRAELTQSKENTVKWVRKKK